MHIQTHMLDALQGYGYDVLGISFMLDLDFYSHDVHEIFLLFF